MTQENKYNGDGCIYKDDRKIKPLCGEKIFLNELCVKHYRQNHRQDIYTKNGIKLRDKTPLIEQKLESNIIDAVEQPKDQVKKNNKINIDVVEHPKDQVKKNNKINIDVVEPPKDQVKKNNKINNEQENDIVKQNDNMENQEYKDYNQSIKLMTEKRQLRTINLKNEQSKINIKFIYQIADIHIKPFCNKVKFDDITSKLYDYLNQQENKDKSLIVICGDILDDPNIIDGTGIHIVSNFLISLQKIMPVLILLGNHDIDRKNTGKPCILEEIIKLISNDRIQLLKDTGIYNYSNIVFATTSIVDIENNEIIPANKIKAKGKCKIFLYHEFIFSIDDTTDEKKEQKIKLFDGYDIVMLGHLHKHTFIKNNICYSGSLFQQDYGEDICGHGLVKWNLDDKTGEFHELCNDYGLFDVIVDSGNIIPIKNVPKYPAFRIVHKNTTQQQLNKVDKYIKANYPCHIGNIKYKCNDVNVKHDITEILKIAT